MRFAPCTHNEHAPRIRPMNMKNRRLIPLLLLTVLLTACGTESVVRKADQFYALGEYSEAATYYKKAYSKTKPKDKPERASRAFMIGECYRRINNGTRALGAYQNAVRYGYPDSIAYRHLATLQLQKGDYKNASANFATYLALHPDDALAVAGQKSCELAPVWKKNPTRWQVKKDNLFNGRRSDYSPVYGDADATTIYWTSTRDQSKGEDKSLITGVKAPDIFVARKDEQGRWQKWEEIEGELNTEYEDGACCFSPDYQTMYFTRCAVDAAAARPAQIYQSKRSDASWGAATLCSFITDSVTNYAHPAVSPDGEWLYFASDLGLDAYGGYDLYRISLSGGTFGGIENLGPAINTAGDELFPTFRPDGTFYFSSNGHPGMGGLDIFEVKPIESAAKGSSKTTTVKTLPVGESLGAEAVPVNLQWPVNSPQDDFGMTFEGPFTRGYFSSNRGDGRGLDHLYSFLLPETIHTLTGWVYEKDGYELPEAVLYLIGNDGTNEKVDVRTDGSFLRRVTPGVSYVLLATCPGYLNYKQELTADSTAENRDYELLFPLSSITRPVLIDNIFFEFDRATLTDASTASLDQLVTLLDDNPGVVIELSCHADYKGSDAYNERLSQRRAESVVGYLTAHGIEAARLVAKGYGESQPKTVTRKLAETHDFLHEGDTLTEEFILTLTDEQQELCNQLNRRTEFRVLRTTYNLYE